METDIYRRVAQLENQVQALKAAFMDVTSDILSKVDTIEETLTDPDKKESIATAKALLTGWRKKYSDDDEWWYDPNNTVRRKSKREVPDAVLDTYKEISELYT